MDIKRGHAARAAMGQFGINQIRNTPRTNYFLGAQTAGIFTQGFA